jgi:hypothetical protein
MNVVVGFFFSYEINFLLIDLFVVVVYFFVANLFELIFFKQLSSEYYGVLIYINLFFSSFVK